jgi:hypothetical protein
MSELLEFCLIEVNFNSYCNSIGKAYVSYFMTVVYR